MKIKYIVKSLTHQNFFLATNVQIGNQVVSFGFKPCAQIIYEAAEFDSKEEAIAACEEAANYCTISRYCPVILEVIAED
ncbi:MAG: hypothetical protein HDS35_01095 [Bacteroides sp.]|nr:hypothetical protein [Bacteroides sp.]